MGHALPLRSTLLQDRREPVVGRGVDDRLCDLVFAREGGGGKEDLNPILLLSLNES